MAQAMQSFASQRLGEFVPAALFLVALAILQIVSPNWLNYFDISTLSASGATLALAAIGGTIVVLSGGLDLSVGAVVSLVNVVLVTWIGTSDLSPMLHALLALVTALAVGGLAGLANGVMIAVLRLQPIIVTLATMFVASGLALLILRYPDGEFSYDASMIVAGDVIEGWLPAPVVVILIGLILWMLLRQSRTGLAIYAIGSDAEAARANGVPVERIKVLTYVIAGLFYGAAGFFVTANTGAGDPMIGADMLLKVFAAIALGGTVIGGGRGGAAGAVAGALILTMLVNILLLTGLRTYYVPVVEGLVLLLAVAGYMKRGSNQCGTLLRGLLPKFGPRPRPIKTDAAKPGRHDIVAALRAGAPAWLLLAVVFGITAFLTGSRFAPLAHLNTLLLFGSFLAILALGQGAVILSGGLDLSVAWAITFPAIVLTTIANGSDAALVWALPLVLGLGALIGLVNGILIVGFGLSPIITTLAVGSVLEGIALVYSNGAPNGSAPPSLTAFVNGSAGSPAAIVCLFLPVLILIAVLLLDLSAFGRKLKAAGENEVVARLSGVHNLKIRLAAYVLSGLCAALAGVLLSGFTGQAYYDMGSPYLLGSIAVVVLGGASISGGRGSWFGIFGGVLLFTALSSMLAATTLPEALRSVIYGLVILGAVLMLRERNA